MHRLLLSVLLAVAAVTVPASVHGVQDVICPASTTWDNLLQRCV
jgi:hypothetical protein